MSKTSPSVLNLFVAKKRMSMTSLRGWKQPSTIMRVWEGDKVNVLKKLVKGNVETSVSVWLSLDENLDYLRKVYRNPCNLEKRKESILAKVRRGYQELDHLFFITKETDTC